VSRVTSQSPANQAPAHGRATRVDKTSGRLSMGTTSPAEDEKMPLASEESATDSNRVETLERSPLKPAAPKRPAAEGGSTALLVFCFFGLQISYLTWGYVQEKVMTTNYATGKFPSATFCVFSNRVLAILVSFVLIVYRHGTAVIPAPLWVFAPCSISNSLSSYGQYQSLRYVSFPLQTLSKSTKVIPVMLMGKLLNNKVYPRIDYIEAAIISLGVSLFSFSESKAKQSHETQTIGVLLLALYVAADSFTSQWQSRVYKSHPLVDQFQMMFAVNVWSALLTLAALVLSGELLISLDFLAANPPAVWDNFIISVTSATGQLFIYYTIRKFGPVVFTIIMTTRQMFSMVLSTISFGHTVGLPGAVGSVVVFGVLFYRIKRGGGGG